jgi:hypothetical protein
MWISAAFLDVGIGGVPGCRLRDGARRGGAAVPVLLLARPPLDAAEERTIRKLAGARHAPGDWIQRARMIAHSWDGLGTTQIADQLGCHPQTVRERLHRFNAEGVDGLGDRPGPGRPRRLTETERGRIIALARSQPPGRLHQGAPPPDVTVVCADELGPVIPRSFPPAPAWTADGHRVKALLDYGRGPEQDLGVRRAPRG